MNSNTFLPGAGCSNTPSGKSLNNIFTSIDYFSFRFSTTYENNKPTFKQLLLLFALDADSVLPIIKGRNGYTEGVQLGSGINLYYGGDITIDKEGHLTSYLEMKVEGCR